MTSGLAQAAMALSFAVPSFVMGFRLLAVWRDPLSIDNGRWVRYGVGLFVLEFILLHAGVALGAAAAASGGGFDWGVVLLLGFYALFAAAIAKGFRNTALFKSFLLVIGGRAVGSLLGISAESEGLFLAHSLIGMVIYFVLVMTSVFLPWPRRGITEAIAAEQRVPGSSGLWVDQPHRAIGPAAVYFLLLGIAELGLLTWIDPGKVSAAAPDADIRVSIRTGAMVAPDSVGPGWARLRVEEDGEGHIVVIFRLPEAATAADRAVFLADLDTMRATPPNALALGGPEVGDTGDVVVELVPGQYVLACVRQGSGGRRHASTGEARGLVVTDAAPAASRADPPDATQDVEMVDFAYPGPEHWTAGAHMLRVVNNGQQDHQLRLALLRPGASMADWVNAEDPGAIGTAIAGVARLGPGAVAYLPVELAAGTYVAHCLVTDPATGRQHVELGMMREIHVESQAP